ncbi:MULTISPECIES: hypothetical protein [Nocardia]|uniref:hypothetical protein n=1 Tax=Nocardia TaxID=1817 RepID=UPI0007E9F01F|nr:MULTISPECIES: hypothetical protein [Nocardia]OBF68696.1 hypothetical protein A9X06_33355 [Mycobacterium sp. 852002-51759_SCH5129042]MBF6272287.1 hypothetical protein [Nocardia nova]OBA48026.1 hypothetical protein A5789_02965 [Nocardia sp. 852002-51101_SCH5132738]OBA48045.1 hypothetical protein A5789_03070 [Nocardia sp. 852002-51101_SCH5132738]OBB47630.1 hypothetical protein A5748_22610 [Nocardia sp. 852002-51244_SCH5132740]
MQREHEEAMRADFATYTDLERKMARPRVTSYEIQLCDMKRHALAERWETGPHADHWAFLEDAYHDWRRNPETMERFRADIAHNLELDGHVGLSDVQLRSLEQARTLTQQQVQRAERPVRER